MLSGSLTIDRDDYRIDSIAEDATMITVHFHRDGLQLTDDEKRVVGAAVMTALQSLRTESGSGT